MTSLCLHGPTQLQTADHHYGLIASSPAHLVNSGNFVAYSEWGPGAPFSIGNEGLRVELNLSPYEGGLCVAAPNCPVPPDYEHFLGIYLKRVFTGNVQCVRAKPHAQPARVKQMI